MQVDTDCSLQVIKQHGKVTHSMVAIKENKENKAMLIMKPLSQLIGPT